MTLTRLNQLTAETRILTDFAYWQSQTAISSTQAKTGTYSYHFISNVGPIGIPYPAGLSQYRVGFWLYLASVSIDGSTSLFQSTQAGSISPSTGQITLQIDSSGGNLLLKRPNSAFSGLSNYETLASAAIPSQFLGTGSWFHVGLNHKIDSSAGWYSVYIDGVRVLQHTGDTRPAYYSGGQVFQNTIAIAFGAGALSASGLNGFVNAYVDDFFADDTTGELDAAVPAKRFLYSIPTGAGHDSQWTPDSGANYTNVDDNPNDGDLTKVKALSADLRDTYVYSDITLPADHRIVAVIPSPFAKRLDSEIDNELSVHAWDGAQYGDSANLELSMSYDIPVFARLLTQPDGTDWNEADFNAMQFGVQSRGSF